MTTGSTNYSFTYRTFGLRSAVKIGSRTLASYTYTSDRNFYLSQLKYGNGDTVSYTYDDLGRVTKETFEDGDTVTYAYNNNGVARTTSYTYDAWGNPLTTTGTLATTLGTLNPLRYRGYVYDQETGLYYLQSRYYDPEVGRFINADAFTSTGQGLLGNNMFAYCGNNPVIRVDLTGFGWVEFWEYVRNWLEEEKEEAESNRDDTKTTGVTLAGAFGIRDSVSVGFTKDTKGNVGVSFTANGGGGFPSAGIGAFHSVNNAPTIYHQRGMGTAIGGSGGPAVIALGVEHNMLIDKENGCTYHGGTISITYGLYPTIVELHGEVGNTWVAGINLYDKAIEFVDFLLGIQEG